MISRLLFLPPIVHSEQNKYQRSNNMAVNNTLVWSNIVAALGAAIVSTLVTAWFFKGSSTPKVPGPPGAVSGIALGLSMFAVETITYIPHILLLFGVIADMFTMEGVYSIPSLVGLLTIPLNYVFKFFWSGLMGVFASIYSLYTIKPSSPFTSGPAASAASESETMSMFENPMSKPKSKPATAAKINPKVLRSLENFGPQMDGGAIKDYDGCDVQGFSFFSSPYAPQTLVVTATVFFYYIFDLISNRGWADATWSILMFAFLYVTETFIIGDCGYPIGKWIRSLLALAEGILFGGSAYGIVQAYYPTKLPSSVLPKFPRKTESDLTKRPDGTYVDENNAPWTILPDGSAIPDMSTGAGLATALGTQATSGSCSTVAPATSTPSA